MLIGTVAAALFPTLELTVASKGRRPGHHRLRCPIPDRLAAEPCDHHDHLIYSASLTLLSIADSIRPQQPTLGQRLATIGLVVGVCYLIGCSHPRTLPRSWQFSGHSAVFIHPWTAINLVDFYWVRRGHYSVREIFNPRGMYGRWCWRGLVAYFVGFAAMIPFFSTGILPARRQTDGWRGLPCSWSAVSAIIYLLACRSLDLEAELKIIAVKDEGLDGPASRSRSGPQRRAGVAPS